MSHPADEKCHIGTDLTLQDFWGAMNQPKGQKLIPPCSHSRKRMGRLAPAGDGLWVSIASCPDCGADVGKFELWIDRRYPIQFTVTKEDLENLGRDL